MTEIRIVSGSYGLPQENGRLSVIRRGQTCEVPEKEAERLVNMGVAAFVKEPVLMAEMPPAPVLEVAPSDTPDGEKNKAPEDLEVPLEDLPYEQIPFDQLKQMAKDAGLPVGKLRSRKNIIDALKELEEGEEPPSMDAEAPVV